MKLTFRILLVLLVATAFTSTSCEEKNPKELTPDMVQNPNTASGDVDTSVLPRMKFEKTDHDFGKIPPGVKISYTYKFTNIGGSALVIQKIDASCGCTSSSFTKEPIPPGGEGRIKLTFDSTGRKGPQHKQATVIANTQPSTQVLQLYAMIVNPNEF